MASAYTETTTKVLLAMVMGVMVQAADLPVGITKCHINDPQVSQCLLRATEQIKPFLIKGIKELNLPSIEPLHVSEISLNQGTNAVNVKAKLTNVIIKGLSNYKFSQFDFDVPNLQWFCKAVVEPVMLEGDYSVDGRILIAPIKGAGKFYVNVAKTNVTGYQKCKLIERNGEEYLSPIVTNTSIEIGGPKVRIDGLFGGNEELSGVTNKIITDNIDVLFQDLKPVIDEIITKIFEDSLVKTLENKVPFKKLYPLK